MAKKRNTDPGQARQILERVVSIFERNFAECHEASNYLHSLGITDANLYSKYRIGYSTGRLIEILPRGSEIRTQLKKQGVLTNNDGEYFSGCVTFPIFDVDGNLQNIYGRFMDDPSTKVWKGNLQKHLFLSGKKIPWNMQIVKTYSEIILADSIVDALSLEMAGFHNVIAIHGGTSSFDQDIKILVEFGVQKLLRLPQDFDANKLLIEHGPDRFAQIVSDNVAPIMGPKPKPVEQSIQNNPYHDFTVCFGSRQYQILGLEKAPRKLKATVRVSHGGKTHVDTLDFYSSRARKILLQDICRIFEQPYEQVEKDLSHLMSECEAREAKQHTDDMPEIVLVEGKEREEAERFGKSGDLVEQIISDINKCGLIGENINKLFCYLAMTSRKMAEPLSVYIVSGSGAGKSALQEMTTEFCPPEDLVKLTTMSGKALFYKFQFSLKNKLLVLEEREGVSDADYAIRNLITAGELISESTVKDLSTGRLTTMVNKVEGPTSVFVTTTDPDIEPENKSRFFIISIDESKQQTQAILEFQRQSKTLAGLYGNLEKQAILDKHRNFQRLLKPLEVVNPYAEALVYPDDRLQCRRDQPKYLNLINAVAFLRQMSKPIKQAEFSDRVCDYIEVDFKDIETANQIAQEIFGRNLDELSGPGQELLALLDEMIEERAKLSDGMKETEIAFSRREVREYTGWTSYRVMMHLRELTDLEYVTTLSGRNGSSFKYRLAGKGQSKLSGSSLTFKSAGDDNLLKPFDEAKEA